MTFSRRDFWMVNRFAFTPWEAHKWMTCLCNLAGNILCDHPSYSAIRHIEIWGVSACYYLEQLPEQFSRLQQSLNHIRQMLPRLLSMHLSFAICDDEQCNMSTVAPCYKAGDSLSRAMLVRVIEELQGMPATLRKSVSLGLSTSAVPEEDLRGMSAAEVMSKLVESEDLCIKEWAMEEISGVTFRS